jgi:hypothetical protein
MEGSCKYIETVDKGWSSSLGVGHGANNPSPYKIFIVTKCFKVPWTWTDSLTMTSAMEKGHEIWYLEC